MPKLDVLPDAAGSREFRSEVAALMATTKDDARDQKTKFEDLARELEADEDEAAFDETLKRIVKTPPKDRAKD